MILTSLAPQNTGVTLPALSLHADDGLRLIKSVTRFSSSNRSGVKTSPIDRDAGGAGPH
jgi:hypothetical protein